MSSARIIVPERLAVYTFEFSSDRRGSHPLRGPNTPTNPRTVAIQEQFSRFFAPDGASLEQTSPYLETPMKSGLPARFDFIA